MKKTEIEFIKDQIKQMLTVKDIVEHYLGSPNNYTKRYKCPFNPDESNCNLEVKEHYWRCFSCGKSGDEIAFVKELFGFKDYPTTIVQIAKDFNLKTSVEYDPEFEKKVKEHMRLKKEREEEERLLALTERNVYNKLLERQRELEEIIKKNSPYNTKKLDRYRELPYPDLVMKAEAQWKKNETLIYVMLQYDLSDCESAIYGWFEDKKDLKKQILRDIINGEIEFNEKGDVISVYGYK